MYSVTIQPHAEREIKRLDKPIKKRILTAVLALASDPRPHGCVKVRTRENAWRIRVGDWRVIYLVDDAGDEVTVIRVTHRSESY